MIIQNIDTLIGIVVGGLLTSFGSYFGSRLLQKNAKIFEKRALMLNYLEEAYMLCNEIICELKNDMRETMALGMFEDNEDKTRRSENKKTTAEERLEMIIEIYFPNLCASREHLTESKELFRSQLFDYYKTCLEKNINADINEFKKVFDICETATNDCLNIKKGIKAEIQSYL